MAIGLENGTLKVVDCCTGETLFEDSGAHSDSVSSIAFSADGRRLATGGRDRTIRVWDTETWATIGLPVEGHSDWVTSVAFSRNGQQLASASDDGTVRFVGRYTRKLCWKLFKWYIAEREGCVVG